jgi:hypothetical protein
VCTLHSCSNIETWTILQHSVTVSPEDGGQADKSAERSMQPHARSRSAKAHVIAAAAATSLSHCAPMATQEIMIFLAGVWLTARPQKYPRSTAQPLYTRFSRLCRRPHGRALVE